MPVELKGFGEMDDNLRQLIRQFPREAAAALHNVGEEVMTISKREYVPVDLGILRASGHVQPPEIRGSVISVTLAFGGAAKDYAVPVHENLTARHTVGSAKYLERPLMSKAGTLEQDLGADIRRWIERRR